MKILYIFIFSKYHIFYIISCTINLISFEKQPSYACKLISYHIHHGRFQKYHCYLQNIAVVAAAFFVVSPSSAFARVAVAFADATTSVRLYTQLLSSEFARQRKP